MPLLEKLIERGGRTEIEIYGHHIDLHDGIEPFFEIGVGDVGDDVVGKEWIGLDVSELDDLIVKLQKVRGLV